MTHELAILNTPKELVRNSTDIAGLCREIVVKSALEIQGRKYVRVEGWQSIATAHGCVASSRDVEKLDDGFRAIGEVRRMLDGGLIAQAEGFVGADEPTWFGGMALVWDKAQKKKVEKMLEKRPDYAIRAMAQTRAISRACRSAFAHVVVLMDAGLSTTPAEEVPADGFDDREPQGTAQGTAQPKQERHTPTKPYEEKPATNTAAATATAEGFRAWCKETGVGPDFVFGMMRNAGNIKDEDTFEKIPPGVLQRYWGKRDGIIDRWKLAGSPKPSEQGKDTPREPATEPEPTSRKRQYNVNTGDRGTSKTLREPCQTDVPAADLLRGEEVEWYNVRVHFGKSEGLRIEEMSPEQLEYWLSWKPALYRGKFNPKDLVLDAALCIASAQ